MEGNRSYNTWAKSKEDLIAGPFCGCGITIAVAQRLQRKWIGIEKEKKYIEASKERLERIRH